MHGDAQLVWPHHHQGRELMLSSPLITITAAPSAPTADHTVIWSVLITQVVTLLIFGLTQWLGHRSDRDKRARDTKRDVLLEVAPAIQRVYTSLAELTNPSTRMDDFAAKLTAASGAVAKLTAVANDETLEAARKLMTALGSIMLRLMRKRVEVGTDLEATKQLIALWREETKVIPDLLADFSTKARSEIPLLLDKNLFGDGLKASNATMFAEMENLLGAFAKQQTGSTRESQAGKAIEDGAQANRGQPNVNASVAQMEAGTHLTPEQMATISTQVTELRQQAVFWEYRYLNHFLVHRTQLVLNWLIDRQTKGQPTTVGYYDAELTARVVSPEERAAVLQALRAHALVTSNDGLLIATEKGLDYTRWRGPIPQVTE